jgi:hypothetical protein
MDLPIHRKSKSNFLRIRVQFSWFELPNIQIVNDFGDIGQETVDYGLDYSSVEQEITDFGLDFTDVQLNIGDVEPNGGGNGHDFGDVELDFDDFELNRGCFYLNI